MRVKSFQCGENFTNCYIVYEENTKDCFLVDVSDRLSREYFLFLENNSLKPLYLLLTHGHYDHTKDILSFKKKYPDTKIVISQKDYENILNNTYVFCKNELFCKPDILVADFDSLDFSGKKIKVLATPGHTDGSVCYLYENMCFCGDTVFSGSVGRTDLPTGSFTEILKSVNKIKNLGDYKLYPGHMEETDIKTEKRYNHFFNI